SQRVRLGAGLTTNLATIRDALAHAEGRGATALIDGAYAGLTVGESNTGRALLIVFSDGIDTSSWLDAETVVETAKRSDVVAYAVSLRSRLAPAFLQDLTGATGGRLLEIEKTANLAASFL